MVALTDAFCGDHLTGEYRDLARAMTASLSRKRPNPLASGQPRTWACGIIHLLGQLNFLSDKASEPHMTMAEVCTRMHPTWMLKRIVDQNPLVWMAKVNGLFVDLSEMPREVQMNRPLRASLGNPEGLTVSTRSMRRPCAVALAMPSSVAPAWLPSGLKPCR